MKQHILQTPQPAGRSAGFSKTGNRFHNETILKTLVNSRSILKMMLLSCLMFYASIRASGETFGSFGIEDNEAFAEKGDIDAQITMGCFYFAVMPKEAAKRGLDNAIIKTFDSYAFYWFEKARNNPKFNDLPEETRNMVYTNLKLISQKLDTPPASVGTSSQSSASATSNSSAIASSPKKVYKTITYDNGSSKYIGPYSDGKRHGLGIYIVASAGHTVKNCSNAKYYVGDWSNNIKQGTGTCYDDGGNLIFEGKFENDKPAGTYPNGSGYTAYKYKKITYTNDNWYEGETKDGKPEGYGVYYWKNGDFWQGAWKDGSRNGPGAHHYKDGSVATGKWEGDKKTQ